MPTRPTSSPGEPRFSPRTLRFFRGLKRNNTRAWFERQRPVYELEVRAPLRHLVELMDVRLAAVAPEITGDPRRSIFRIHRDIRFSRDKSPYQISAGCWFYHQDAGRAVGQDAEGGGAGFYFHLEPGRCIVAGGCWMPERSALKRLRERLADDWETLEKIVRAPGFRRRYGGLDQDAMLKRMPRGYAADHPAADWLRYQSFTAHRRLTDRQVLGPALPALLARDFAALLPLVRWLNRGLGFRPRRSRFSGL
ncbi:MAG: DUF2461 domain-containing protein [Gemmatimonadales bacterium]